MADRSDISNRVDQLRRVEPFDSLPAEACRDVAQRAAYCRYDDDEVLRPADTAVERAIFLLEGQVKVVTDRLDDAELILGIFGPRHPAGGLGLFSDTYPGRIEALSEVCTAEIAPSELRDTLEEADVGIEPFFEVATERTRYLARRLHDATVRPAERRLGLVFEMFRDIWGDPLDDGPGVHVPLSIRRRDLAALINTRTETAIRLVRDWERAGLVRTESDGFVIPDPAEIEAVVADA